MPRTNGATAPVPGTSGVFPEAVESPMVTVEPAVIDALQEKGGHASVTLL